MYLKFMNGFYMTRSTFISVTFSPNIDMAFEQRFLAMTEKRKETRDNNEVCAAVLTDLSKVFDCLLHDLLTAKLHTFGFSFKSLGVIHAYLNDRIRVTKVGSFYSNSSSYLQCPTRLDYRPTCYLTLI